MGKPTDWNDGREAAVIAYLDKTDPAAAAIARERYGCLTPWQSDPSTYGRAVLTAQYRKCEDAVVAQCRDLLQQNLQHPANGSGDFLDASRSARLIAAAEKCYRIMYSGGAESWNLRDRHMLETLENTLTARGRAAKAIVWAHNTHVGDARFTDVGEYAVSSISVSFAASIMARQPRSSASAPIPGRSPAPANGVVPWK